MSLSINEKLDLWAKKLLDDDDHTDFRAQGIFGHYADISRSLRESHADSIEQNKNLLEILMEFESRLSPYYNHELVMSKNPHESTESFFIKLKQEKIYQEGRLKVLTNAQPVIDEIKEKPGPGPKPVHALYAEMILVGIEIFKGESLACFKNFVTEDNGLRKSLTKKGFKDEAIKDLTWQTCVDAQEWAKGKKKSYEERLARTYDLPSNLTPQEKKNEVRIRIRKKADELTKEMTAQVLD